MKKSATKSYALRIDAQLVKPLQDLKKQNRRSLNAEINAALEDWIVRSRPADTSSIPMAPAAANGSKEKRKPTKKPSATPAQG